MKMIISSALLLCLLGGVTNGQEYSNFVSAVPNGLYPAPPPGQFQYLYTPVTTTSRRFQAPQPTKKTKTRQQKKTKVRSRVRYTYIPIELLTALINEDVRTHPLDPIPLSNDNSSNNIQLGSGVFIRVPLRFRNSSALSQTENSNQDPSEEDDDEKLVAIADDEVIPMEMFEEMLEMDMRRRFNTSSPIFNSAEGIRVTLNNLLRLFAPPASLLRRAGSNQYQQQNIFNRLLRDRYQLSSGIFNGNNNNI